MRAFASVVGGLCVFEKGQKQQFVNVADMSQLESEAAHLACGAIDDWEVIDSSDREALIREVEKRHRIARGIANVETCLIGMPPSLQKELLGEVEDLLMVLGVSRELEATLLRAPLASDEALTCLVESCLSEGFAAVASLLENVRDSQPLLRRLTNQWSSIPEQYFATLPGGRQQAWSMAVVAGVVLESLAASSYQDFERAWVALVFSFNAPIERSAISKVSKAFAARLFPEHSELGLDHVQRADPDHSGQEVHQVQPIAGTSHKSYENALTQVEAIIDAVANGRDALAMRYLNELTTGQLKIVGGEEYAVKSVCNIAQRCSEMFRTDFEYLCLESALKIKPDDGWMLVQIADHFKRVGLFDEAISTLEKAKLLGEKRIATSSLADVYVQMRQFDKALEIYGSIEGAEYDVTIRQAIADTFRRSGKLDQANREYERIIDDGLVTDRVLAGQAEIAKREGRLQDARDIYLKVLDDDELDESSSVIYRLALTNVLVRMGDLPAAYSYVDDVVQRRPFARQARVLRAAVAGLLGKADEAIVDLPELGQTHAFKEWVSEYVRGLLLLMLGRFGDARTALLQNVEERLLDKDSAGVVRIGAAVCFLRTRDGVECAAEKLSEVPEMDDSFANTILVALRYHVAVSLRQNGEIDRLERQLSSVDDDDIKSLLKAIRLKDWKVAWNLEVRTLLRLAA